MPGSAEFIFSIPGLGSVAGGSGTFLIAAACIVAAILGLFRGWRRTVRIPGPARCRLARSLLFAFFLTPSHLGSAPAPAFVCLFAGLIGAARGHKGAADIAGEAVLAMLAGTAALFLLGTLVRLAWQVVNQDATPTKRDDSATYSRVPHHAEKRRRR